MIRFKRKKLQKDQNGMASILVTIIMMILVSLVVLGFSQVAQREQQESLTRQLSLQALYSAESGINDVLKVIQTDASTGNPIPAKTTCGTGSASAYNTYQTAPFDENNNESGTNIGQSYTCLLVNPTPTTLIYNPSTQQSQVATIDTTPDAVGSITLSWQNPDYSSSNTFNCSNNNSFPPASNPSNPNDQWGETGTCGAGVLRIDIVPATNISAASTSTYFLDPSASGSEPTITYGTNNGKVQSVYCQNPTSQASNACAVIINGLTADSYYMRLSTIYSNSTVDITGANPFNNSETEIDSTGRIGSVLRRLVAYVPVTGIGTYPDYAIESNDSVCKQYGYTAGPPAAVVQFTNLPNCASAL